MSDTVAALEAAREHLTDIALRSMDMEKFLFVDEFNAVARVGWKRREWRHGAFADIVTHRTW